MSLEGRLMPRSGDLRPKFRCLKSGEKKSGLSREFSVPLRTAKASTKNPKPYASSSRGNITGRKDGSGRTNGSRNF